MSIVQLGKWIEEFLDQTTDQTRKEQVTMAHPDLTVAETARAKRITKAVDEFLEKVAE